jgi:TctA family transporter
MNTCILKRNFIVFFREFRNKFGNSRLDNIDNWTRYAIFILGLCGIVFSGFLHFQIFNDVKKYLSFLPIESGWLTNFFSGIFVASIIISMWFFWNKITELMKEIRFSPSDFDKNFEKNEN